MSRRTTEATAAFLLCVAPVAAHAQLAPTDREAAIADARAAVTRGDHPAAIARLEGARAALPDDPEILRLLGSAYAYAKRYPEAIATLRQARTLAPDDLDIRAALARAYLWSGD
ncbi:MAG TPA: tetratricopeptide repeat protein, partial [Sphingomonas sp.]|nr:tetratricopeptide repeat protein [Sphingomonas sp.]